MVAWGGGLLLELSIKAKDGNAPKNPPFGNVKANYAEVPFTWGLVSAGFSLPLLLAVCPGTEAS